MPLLSSRNHPRASSSTRHPASLAAAPAWRAVRVEAQQQVAEPVREGEGRTPPAGPAPRELAALHQPQVPLTTQPVPVETSEDRVVAAVGDRDLSVVHPFQ